MFFFFLIAAGVSSLVLAIRLIFCGPAKSRIISCLISPGISCLLSIAGYCVLEYLEGAPTYAYHGYALTLYISPGFLSYSYLALPIGIVLGIVLRIIVGAFRPYEPYKADKKR